MKYGVIDFSRIDTTPGAMSAFSPPEDWDGDYVDYMRECWKKDPGFRQHVSVVGLMLRLGRKVEFQGRFASEAKRIAELAA
jgi:hypothetical protein